MDCSLPGFSVHGLLQATILEWDALLQIFLTQKIGTLSHPSKKKKKETDSKKIFQVKVQVKNLQAQINEEETGTLPEKEFRVIIKTIRNLRTEAWIEKIEEMFGTSLVVQWLRIRLATQGTHVCAWLGN